MVLYAPAKTEEFDPLVRLCKLDLGSEYPIGYRSAKIRYVTAMGEAEISDSIEEVAFNLSRYLVANNASSLELGVETGSYELWLPRGSFYRTPLKEDEIDRLHDLLMTYLSPINIRVNYLS